MPLIKYYQDRDDTLRIDEMLGKFTHSHIQYAERDEVLRLFVARGLIDKAYESVLEYGPEAIDPQILARLASLIIERDGMVENRKLSSIIYSAFERGKYNEAILAYMAVYFKGSSKVLRNIWKAASGFYVDTYKICERILSQSLFTGVYIGEEVQIFREYVEGGADTEFELQYLTYLSHEFFVKDRVVDEYIFQEIAKIYDNEGEIPIVCMLAFLKYYAENADVATLTHETKSHIRRFIRTLYVDRKMSLPFMKAFKTISMEALEMSNQSMIEYHGEQGSVCTVNYCISREGEEQHSGYIREEMNNVYGGVFVKSFLLFFGETLQYYITENFDGMEQLTSSGTLGSTDVDSDMPGNRYGLVNDIAISTTLKDYDTALGLLEEYKYKEYLVDKLFTIQ